MSATTVVRWSTLTVWTGIGVAAALLGDPLAAVFMCALIAWHGVRWR